jgi:hypothetical protein
MINKGTQNSEELRIQGLIGSYLQFRSATAAIDAEKSHLDEDLLTAFVEGSLTQRESKPVLSHLVDCSFCRHVTAELVKLDFAFADETIAAPAAIAQSEPTSVSDVLNNLLSRIFGSHPADSAVLAHQEPEKNSEEEDANKSDKGEKNNDKKS